MTTSSDTALTVDEFAARVERACADLPEPVRRRLMADLDTHLRELADQGDLVSAVGTPEDYARDLREALEIPAAGMAGLPTVTTPIRTRLLWNDRPRWWLPVAIAVTVVIVVLAIVAALGFGHTSHRASSPPVQSAAAVPTLASIEPLPDLVGLTVDAATAQLQSLGFQVRIVTDPPSSAASGTVIGEDPNAHSPIQLALPVGSTVTLHVAP